MKGGNNYSKKVSTHIRILCFILIMILMCTGICKCEEGEASESQIMDEIDTLYSELLTIEESIGRSLRKIQLLKKIQTNRIIVPEMGIQPVNQTENHRDNILNKENRKLDILSEKIFNNDNIEEPTIEEIALSNTFFERITFEAKNTSFVKFKFLTTPHFVDKDNDYVTKVVIAIHSDGSLGVYSTNTGKMLNQFDLNQKINEIADYIIPTTSINWSKDIIEFITESFNDNMRVTILTVHGNIYLFELKVEVINKEAMLDKTLGKPSQKLNIFYSYGFNVWQTVINSNTTLYSDEIKTLQLENLAPISMSYFGNLLAGNYIIGDNKGFFNIIKKDERKNGKFGYEFNLLKRVYSGFGDLNLVTNQHFLTMYTFYDKFGFIRSIDGEIADTNCGVNNTEIVGVTFDKTQQGGYYVATKSGEISVFLARQNLCILIGNFQTGTSYLSNIKALKKTFLTYDDNTGEFTFFDMSKFKKSLNGIDLSSIIPLTYKPSYWKYYTNLPNHLEETQNEFDSDFKPNKLELVEDPTDLGYNLLIRIPGTSNKLLLFDIITQGYEETPWYNQALENKGILFVGLVIIIVAINVCKFTPRDPDGPETRENKDFRKKINDVANQRDKKLEEISQQLLNFENVTKGYSDFNENIKGSTPKDAGLKSGLKSGHSGIGSKKNVRFAED